MKKFKPIAPLETAELLYLLHEAKGIAIEKQQPLLAHLIEMAILESTSAAPDDSVVSLSVVERD